MSDISVSSCFIFLFSISVHMHLCATSVCEGAQVWCRGHRQLLLLLVLTFHLIWEGLCCFPALCSSLAGCWASGDVPLSASHLPLGTWGLQMCCHSWLDVGSWCLNVVFMIAWQVLLATDSSLLVVLVNFDASFCFPTAFFPGDAVYCAVLL